MCSTKGKFEEKEKGSGEVMTDTSFGGGGARNHISHF
jgi:hypothetical protein